MVIGKIEQEDIDHQEMDKLILNRFFQSSQNMDVTFGLLWNGSVA